MNKKYAQAANFKAKYRTVLFKPGSRYHYHNVPCFEDVKLLYSISHNCCPSNIIACPRGQPVPVRGEKNNECVIRYNIKLVRVKVKSQSLIGFCTRQRTHASLTQLYQRNPPSKRDALITEKKRARTCDDALPCLPFLAHTGTYQFTVVLSFTVDLVSIRRFATTIISLLFKFSHRPWWSVAWRYFE